MIRDGVRVPSRPKGGPISSTVPLSSLPLANKGNIYSNFSKNSQRIEEYISHTLPLAVTINL